MSLIDGLEHIVRTDESLAAHTSVKIGGNAAYFAEPTNQQELLELVKRFSGNGTPVYLIGDGSNLLVSDAGVDGLVIRLSSPDFSKIEVDGSTVVAGGGAKMAHVIATSVREGLAGLHNLVGIPGTVGGALNGNAGTQGYDIGSRLKSAKVVTREGELLERDSFSFSHRQSSLNELVILEATFELEKDEADRLTKSMQQKWIVSRASQPFAHERSLYVFQDHGGEAAAEVIERAGLKGLTLGPVSISERNLNCLKVEGDAKSADIEAMISHIQEKVRDSLNIDLEPAIQIW